VSDGGPSRSGCRGIDPPPNFVRHSRDHRIGRDLSQQAHHQPSAAIRPPRGINGPEACSRCPRAARQILDKSPIAKMRNHGCTPSSINPWRNRRLHRRGHNSSARPIRFPSYRNPAPFSFWLVLFVRVADCANETEIRRALEAGAEGIFLPMIQSAEDVRAAADAAFFPPKGGRGICPAIRAAGYDFRHFEQYTSWNNAEIALIPMIEHPQAVENIDEICALASR
jgi:hypothetical protein